MDELDIGWMDWILDGWQSGYNIGWMDGLDIGWMNKLVECVQAGQTNEWIMDRWINYTVERFKECMNV